MQIKQKLLIGVLLVSLLIFGFSFGINILVQNKTFEIFQEVGGEILPGDIALSRMTTELFRVVILLDKYENNPDPEIHREIETALSSMDVYKTTHQLYHSDDDLAYEIEQLVQTFSREVVRYELLLQKGSDIEQIWQVRKKIDRLLERFLKSLNPAIDKSMANSYQKIIDVQNINKDSYAILLLGAFIILIFSLILSVYIAQKFSNPLKNLRDAALEIGSGNLDIHLPAGTKDEISDLSRAFNKMISDLKETRKELDDKHQILQKHKDNLEELIYIRTEELQKSNMTLKNTLEELKSTQEQLIETEKMASLSGIVSGVAHEINTPLGVCITAGSFLEDSVNDLKKNFESNEISRNDFESYIDKAENFCKTLNENLETSVNLINCFKQVAVGQEQFNSDWRNINLYDYINTIISTMEMALRKNRISINNRCDPSISIYTSPGIISQIFTTLISNSLTHAFDKNSDGQIVIRAEEFPNHILLDFHDNGKGILKEHINHIFEPFFTTRRGHKDSTGLGLSIIYNLISRSLKGRIKVQSKAGEGTNFYIELPHMPDTTSYS